jgi:rod shape determining protein RodA
MLDLDRKQHFDFPLFFTAIALWIIGVALVYSATHIYDTGPLVGLAKSQIVWVIMGILIILALVSLPSRFYYSFAYVFYGLSLIMLLFVVVGGVASKGAARWIAIGPIRLQPSEFGKLGLMFALARYLSKHTVTLTRLSSFVMPGILIMVPFALVLKQPDLGTALVFGAMALPMFYWAGMPLIEIFYVISPGISVALSALPLILAFGKSGSFGIAAAIPWGLFFIALCAVLYFFRPHTIILVAVIAANLAAATMTTVLWNSFLKDYQKTRIISFIDPQMDAFGSGYQVIQSKVAIGSGHFFGKGYLQGSQTRLSYLPEQHTDFIFSVLGEQFGLIGCTAVLLLFFFLIARGYLITQHCRNRFANLAIVGSLSIVTFHVFVNVAMTLGIMPVVGVPLPFLSYGGSFTLSLGILLGFILNARMKGHDF